MRREGGGGAVLVGVRRAPPCRCMARRHASRDGCPVGGYGLTPFQSAHSPLPTPSPCRFAPPPPHGRGMERMPPAPPVPTGAPGGGEKWGVAETSHLAARRRPAWPTGAVPTATRPRHGCGGTCGAPSRRATGACRVGRWEVRAGGGRGDGRREGGGAGAFSSFLLLAAPQRGVPPPPMKRHLSLVFFFGGLRRGARDHDGDTFVAW